jgi:nucleotide-binding universal stress UspA family protein
LCSVADLPPQAIPIQGAAITLPTGPVHTPVDMATYLEELSRGLQADGFVVEIQVAMGDPAPAIARIATEARAGLIAMSTHGRHGLARWALGSITESVIQQAPVPVLALHPAEF